MRSRFLADLTTPELDAYLATSPTTAILPVGSQEMHGPHQPTGTDMFIARAMSLRLAERADGVVLPDIPYTWCGATDGFAGTISVAPELVRQTVETVVLKAHRMGFDRQIILSNHGGNRCVLELAVRRVYEMHHIPVAYVRHSTPTCAEVAQIFSGASAAAQECSLTLAALHILGKGDLYRQEDLQYDDPAPPPPESLREARARGAMVGFFYQDSRQHVSPSAQTSLEKGMAFIDRQVQELARMLDHLGEYCRDVRGQANRGWWREG